MSQWVQAFKAHLEDIGEGLLGLGMFTFGWWHRFMLNAEGVAQAITIFLGAAITVHSAWRVFVRPWFKARGDARRMRRRATDVK